MNKFIYCDKCGYNKEVKAILFDKCPRCNTPLIIIGDTKDEAIGEIIEKDELERGKLNLKLVGNNNAWDFIEAIKNPFTRIEKRNLFIKAGGIIPEKEIKI